MLRAYVRYFAPLTLLSLVVFAPYLATALRTPVPPDADTVRAIAKLTWSSLGYVAIAQLVLVGAAAPLFRARGTSPHDGQPLAPLGQRAALVAGARQLVRALVPIGVALTAVIAGSLALALPGLALLALFSLTAASDEPGLAGPLVESAAVVRLDWPRVAAAILAIALADVAIAFAAQRFGMISPTQKPITPADFARVRFVVRAVAAAFTLLSPLAACALAALHAKGISDMRRDASRAPAASPPAMPAPPAEGFLP